LEKILISGLEKSFGVKKVIGVKKLFGVRNAFFGESLLA